MIQMEELYEKILTEMDLSKEVEDDELVEIIHRILDEKGKLTNDDYNRTYKINEKFKLLNNEIGKYLSKLEF